MTDLKITQLPAADALTGTEIVPVVQDSTTKRTTAQEIADLAAPGGGSSVVASNFSSDSATPYLMLAIPGNSFGAQETLEIDSFFSYDQNGAGNTFELDVAFGSANFRFPITGSGGGSSDLTGYIHFHFKVQNLNSVSAQLVSAQCTYGFGQASGPGQRVVQGGQYSGGSNGPFAIDTTTSNNFRVDDSTAPTGILTHRATIARVIP